MIKNPAISGALFDFLGWATSQPGTLKLGSGELVPPAVQAVEEWAKLRGLDLEEADVHGWNDEEPYIANPPDVRCEGCGCEISDKDSPNIIIGKNPGQYCSRCVANGSIIRRGDGDWIYEPIIKEAV